MFICLRPRWLSWMRHPTGDQEVAGSTPTVVGNILSWRLIMKYFLRSFSPFRWFKKGSCQFLTQTNKQIICLCLKKGLNSTIKNLTEKKKNTGQLILHSNAYLKIQNRSIHGSKDMNGLKSVTYGQTNRRMGKPKAICPHNQNVDCCCCNWCFEV